jgi:hypothetical protein
MSAFYRAMEVTRPRKFSEVRRPPGAGFIRGLRRPGGNLTGFTPVEFSVGGEAPSRLSLRPWSWGARGLFDRLTNTPTNSLFEQTSPSPVHCEPHAGAKNGRAATRPFF